MEPSKSDSIEKATEKLRETAQQAEFAKLLNTHSGGMYIPPARIQAVQEAASLDKTSVKYQQLSWDALCKSCYKYKACIKYNDLESWVFLGVNQCNWILVTTELVCGPIALGGSKLDPRSTECRFLGYASGSGNYKVQDVASRRVFISRDVIFEEGQPHRTTASVGEQHHQIPLLMWILALCRLHSPVLSMSLPSTFLIKPLTSSLILLSIGLIGKQIPPNHADQRECLSHRRPDFSLRNTVTAHVGISVWNASAKNWGAVVNYQTARVRSKQLRSAIFRLWD